MHRGTLFLLGNLVAITACSSGDSSALDAAADNTTGQDSATDSPTGTDATSDVVVTEAGSNCSLHPPALDGSATIYCPFSGGDGGANVYCTAGTQHCCEPTTGIATCVSSGTACTGSGADWQCEDPVADCTDPAKPVCCAAGANYQVSDAGTCNFATQLKGAACVASGTCINGITLCTSNGECPQGKTCAPFTSKGNQLGACI